MKWFKALLIALITMYISLWGVPYFLEEKGNLFFPLRSYAENDWRVEFNDICSKTNTAMSLTKEELTSLIERCDKLKATIETLDETPKKVYLKRLQMCRDMFVFVIENIEKKEENKP
ncbi:MAG: hypothetical protein Q8N09_08250 [Thermodesulfovibrionia bacterium]|nr:hypothetical protein [Thermodesulfovibrionia bacterium]